MHTEFEICDRNKLVIVRCSGLVTAQGCDEGFEKYHQNVAHPLKYNFLVDFSQADDIEISFTQMLTMSFRRQEVFAAWGQVRIAFLAPRTPVFAMARMYAAVAYQAENLEAQAFQDQDEAMAFLANTVKAQ